MRTLAPRLLVVAFTAVGARESLGLLRIFLTPEALRGPRAAFALFLLPSLIGLALALVPDASARLAAAALYGRSPRRLGCQIQKMVGK